MNKKELPIWAQRQLDELERVLGRKLTDEDYTCIALDRKARKTDVTGRLLAKESAKIQAGNIERSKPSNKRGNRGR